MCAEIVKVVLLGSTSVGKTTMITRWCDGEFDPNKMPTLGAGFRSQELNLNDQDYMFQVWDTAGQDTFRETTSVYCRGAKAAMIVFDLTNKSSFDDIPEWIETLYSKQPNIPIVIAGNKSDKQEREVSFQEAFEYASNKKCQYFETSAYTGYNIEEAFTALVSAAVMPPLLNSGNETPTEVKERGVNDVNKPKTVEITNESQGEKKGGCCG
ncbi:Ras-related protein RABA5a [Tritrichomonas foetus]|uniref:Ras-related protein RABA5a n=1 Tax=Tritrichomonas foetus TaxID=1144522 RepID=A0A1J4JVY0_9EUKA|nr:Ras-related protein RABA5a [Tritrichomonas foetus]|eukprot:OHT03287.1 Ras-related protein RABA5a [Tritrichomonas foetus]